MAYANVSEPYPLSIKNMVQRDSWMLNNVTVVNSVNSHFVDTRIIPMTIRGNLGSCSIIILRSSLEMSKYAEDCSGTQRYICMNASQMSEYKVKAMTGA